jgi:hypothetical protein
MFASGPVATGPLLRLSLLEQAQSIIRNSASAAEHCGTFIESRATSVATSECRRAGNSGPPPSAMRSFASGIRNSVVGVWLAEGLRAVRKLTFDHDRLPEATIRRIGGQRSGCSAPL